MTDQPILRISAQPHTKWEEFWNSRAITLQPSPRFTQDDRIFTMGSCFAYEIKKALTARGITCLPDYADYVIDTQRIAIENFQWNLFHLQHYNTFTVLQELERATGDWQQDKDDYWTLKRSPTWPGEATYQDPYRRSFFARSPQELHDFAMRLDGTVRAGFDDATAFFFTFGMTEVFRQKSNGRVVAQRPLYAGGGGTDETEFYQSSFADNFANVDRIVQLIRARKPDARIVMTVSPVPLARCFSGRDLVVANTESKAMLRTVLAEIVRKYPDVLYFPSYEAVMSQPLEAVFGSDDRRHVHDSVVAQIMESFIAAYFDLPAPATGLGDLLTIR